MSDLPEIFQRAQDRVSGRTSNDTRSQAMQAAQQRPQRRPMPRQMRQQAPPGPPPRDRQIYGMNQGDVLERRGIDTEQARYNWTYGDLGERLSAIPQLAGEATGLNSLRYLPHALRAGDNQSTGPLAAEAVMTLGPEIAGAARLRPPGRMPAIRARAEPPPAPIRPPAREIARASDGSVLPVAPRQPFRTSLRGSSDDLREAAGARRVDDAGGASAGKFAPIWRGDELSIEGAEGAGGGGIRARIVGDQLRIEAMGLPEGLRNQGLGQRLLETAIREGQARGLNVVSDVSVTDDFLNAARALQRRGAEVTEAPNMTRAGRYNQANGDPVVSFGRLPDGGPAQGGQRVVYRGLSKPYDPNNGGYYQSFTSSADDAREYGSNVMAARINPGRNLAVDGGGNNFNALSVAQLPADVRAKLHPGIGSSATTDQIAHAAREAGYDSVTVRNVHDNRWGERPVAGKEPRTIDFVFDTRNITPVDAPIPQAATATNAEKVRLSDADRALLAELEDLPESGGPAVGGGAGQFVDEAIGGNEQHRMLSTPDGAGALEYWRTPNGPWRVRQISVEAAHQGKGVARSLYEDLLGRARKAGLTEIHSDDTLTPEALRVYDSLRRRGYAQNREQTLSNPLPRGQGNYQSDNDSLIRISTQKGTSEPLASSVGGVPVPQVVQRDLRRVGAMVQRRFVDRPPNEGLQRTIIPSAGRNGDEIVIRYGFNGEAPHRGALQNVSDWNGTQTGEITLRKGPFGRLYITGSQIDPLLQEKGLGTQMYADVADWANARGSQLFSDNLMSDGARNVYPALARRGYDIRNVSKDVDAQPRNAPGTPEDERMVFTVASNDQKPIYRIRGRGETPSSTTLYSNMGVPAVIQRDLANVGRLATDGAGAAPRALPRQYEGFGGRAVAMGDAAKLPPEAWATATYAPPRAMRPRTAQDKLAAGLLGIGGAVPAGAGAAYAVQDNIGRGARTQDARLRVQEARQADLHNDVRNMNAGGGSPLMAPKAGFPSLLPPVSPQLHEQARAEIQGLIPEREWGVIDEGLIRRQADVIQRGLRYRGKEPLDAPPPRIFPRDRFAGKRPQQNAPAFRGPGR